MLQKRLKVTSSPFSTAAFVEVSHVVTSTEMLGAHWQLLLLNYLVAWMENTVLYRSARNGNFSVAAT
jgi:hypothetical protein